MSNLKLKNKLNLKSLTIGITLGVTVSSFIPVFGAVQEYLLTKVNYSIIVNGQEYSDNELPVLNLNGSTYVPLRAVGDILEVKVDWNEELKRVEIGEVINQVNNINNNHILDSKIPIENELILYPNGEKVYVRINKDGLYDNSNFILAHKGSDTYSNAMGIYILLNILADNHDIVNSQNPFLKGGVSIKTNPRYKIEVQSEYIDITTPKKTYVIYDSLEPSKKYLAPYDSLKNGQLFINADEVLSFFGYPKDIYVIESNDKDGYMILNIN